MGKTEYALAGVDYEKIQPYKDAMAKVAKSTLLFPNFRDVQIRIHEHGANFRYVGNKPHSWGKVVEGLGNKNWVAEWMYQFSGTGKTFHEDIPTCAVLMAVNDLIAQGAMPVLYMDETACGKDSWFEDEKRTNDVAEGFYKICKQLGMALGGGESPALKYLLKSEPPIDAAPSFSGCAIGIIAPASREITEGHLRPGDRIVGATSSGIHANGFSLVIKRCLALPEQFLTKLPDGKTLGEHALTQTRSYVGLVEALLDAEIDIHGLLPGTGDGVAKLAFDKSPFTYLIHTWPKDIPLIFQFMLELGIPLFDCLKTFNWGIGYYIFVPKYEVETTIRTGDAAGYELHELGEVVEGKRGTIFEPAGDLFLPPPGQE